MLLQVVVKNRQQVEDLCLWGGVRAVFLRNGNAGAVYRANPTIFNAMNLKLSDGSLVNSESSFNTYCIESDYNSPLFNFVKVK